LDRLKAVINPKQSALFFGWLFGIKAFSDFNPIWSSRLAALRRAPFGRYFPCFQSLSALQLDSLGALLPGKISNLEAAQQALAITGKGLAAAEGDDAINTAILAIHEKRGAMRAAEKDGMELIMTKLTIAQRAEVTALSARWSVRKKPEGAFVHEWWATALKEAGLEEAPAPVVSMLAELSTKEESLRVNELESVEVRLPFEKDLQQKVLELEKALEELNATTETTEKEILSLLNPVQQKAVVMAVLQPFVA